MARRCWNKVRPTSLRNALELCKDHAKDKKNSGVERIAEEMGLPDHWLLYKYLQTGRMPAVLIPAYEAACGIDFVTRWLAARSGYLMVKVPSGRAVTVTDVGALQQSLHHTVSALMTFYAGKAKPDETLAAIAASMESLAWHRGNVEQFEAPQLDF